MLSFAVYKRRHSYADRNKTAECEQGLAEGQPLGAPLGAGPQNYQRWGGFWKPGFLGLASETVPVWSSHLESRLLR